MACSTCDGYEFVRDEAGMLVDCPDCRALETEPRRFCPVHGRRVIDGRCVVCSREARIGAELLLERARAAAVSSPPEAYACR